MSVVADAENEEQIKQSGHEILTIAMDMIESGDATGVVIVVDFNRPIERFPARAWLSWQRNAAVFSDGRVATLERVNIVSSNFRDGAVHYLSRNENAIVQVLEWRL